MGQFHQRRVVGVLENQAQGQAFRCFNVVQGGHQLHPAVALRVGQHCIEVGFGRRRIERCAITEAHAVTKRERVGLAVIGNLPGFSQPRLQRTRGGIAHQGLIDHGLGVHLVWGVATRVERPGIHRPGVHQPWPLLGGAAGRRNSARSKKKEAQEGGLSFTWLLLHTAFPTFTEAVG
ncbi:hypothetical protein D3C81_1125860 [compost metagenome]